MGAPTPPRFVRTPAPASCAPRRDGVLRPAALARQQERGPHRSTRARAAWNKLRSLPLSQQRAALYREIPRHSVWAPCATRGAVAARPRRQQEKISAAYVAAIACRGRGPFRTSRRNPDREPRRRAVRAPRPNGVRPNVRGVLTSPRGHSRRRPQRGPRVPSAPTWSSTGAIVAPRVSFLRHRPCAGGTARPRRRGDVSSGEVIASHPQLAHAHSKEDFA
jgi:hypothetical protein